MKKYTFISILLIGVRLVEFSDLNSAAEQDVVIQGMMTDLVLPLAAQMGASLAGQQISGAALELTNILMRQSNTIQANIKSFQSQSQNAQKQSLQAKIADFLNKGKDIQTQTTAAIATSNLELDYLYKNISLNQPASQYLTDQVLFDQIFSQGIMLTPYGHIWRNPFSVGDWEYDKDDNSFWQHQKSAVFATSSTGASSAAKAENNAIFTEYTTTAATYKISGVITFYQIDYPFFVGIIFNKARWISGNYESLRKSRMIGVYGVSDSNIGIYYTEQFTMTDDQIKASSDASPIQTPLQQILHGKSDKKITIPADTFKNMKAVPVSLNFEIINSSTSVTFTFWNKKIVKNSVTIAKIDPLMFMYHGIGFICPGAIASFHLTEPKDLVFSAQAISKYKD